MTVRTKRLCSLLSSILAAKQQINISLVYWEIKGYAVGQTESFRAPSAGSQGKLLQMPDISSRSLQLGNFMALLNTLIGQSQHSKVCFCCITDRCYEEQLLGMLFGPSSSIRYGFTSCHINQQKDVWCLSIIRSLRFLKRQAEDGMF